MRRAGVVQLFEPFVEPPRAANGSPDRPGWQLPANGLTGPAAEPALHLETGEGTELAPRRTRICETAACSIVAHGAGLVALITVPILLSTALPHPAGVVRAFFVEPMVAPPPPPPPPAPTARTAPRRAAGPETASTDAFVAPIEIPSELRPEEGLDLGIEGGMEGGVEGGVPGGVVGAVVGGLPALAPPPPAVPAVRVGGDITKPVKVKDIPPTYPELAAKAGIQGIVIVEAVVDIRGHVMKATILRGIPLLDEAALDAVTQWKYTPTLINGVPTPIIMTVTVAFTLKKAGPWWNE